MGNDKNADKTLKADAKVPDGPEKVAADQEYAKSLGSDDGKDGGAHPERPEWIEEEFGIPAEFANSPAKVAEFLASGNDKADKGK